MPVPEITAGQALALTRGGLAVVVDLRGPAEFAQGHPKDALNVPFSERGLATRIALVAPRGAGVVLLGDDEARLARAVRQVEEAADSGRPPLAGVLDGGWEAWQQGGHPSQALEEVSVHALGRLLANGVPPVVLDVREPIEWEMGHVPGAVLISLGELRGRVEELDPSRPVLVICEAGVRSSTAASLLQGAGFAAVANVVEGTGGYRSAGYPLEYLGS